MVAALSLMDDIRQVISLALSLDVFLWRIKTPDRVISEVSLSPNSLCV